jgi:hypothetical protein
MQYNEIELMEMAQDYEAMERQALEDTEELRQLRSGEKLVELVDIDHAIQMLHHAQRYISAERWELMNTIKGKECLI